MRPGANAVRQPDRSAMIRGAGLTAPILVVGAARSGTTLTAAILGRHPRILSLGETHFYEDIWSRGHGPYTWEETGPGAALARRTLSLFGRYNFPDDQRFVDDRLTLPALLAEAASTGSDLHALYSAFARLAARAAGKDALCDHTPRHAFYLETILAGLPGVKAVALVRDPRDYLASYKYYWRRSTESSRVRALYHPINSSLLWRSTWSHLSRLARADGSSRVLLVRYEDLVTDPERIARGICAFLGIDYLPEVLEVDSSNSSFGSRTGGIFTSSVGRWRDSLTDAEVWWCQRITGSGLTRLGYAVAPVQARAGSVTRLLLTSPISLVSGLWANRAKRGPLAGYLARRARGLFRRD